MTDDASIRPDQPHTERGEVAPAHETEKVRMRQALSASAVHDALLREGREEISRHAAALALSGLAAGLSMGLSFVAQAALHHHLPAVSWRPLVTSLGYAVGFLAVTMGRQQLYTETTLTAFLPFAHDRTSETFVKVLRLWTVVLLANIAGGVIFVTAIVYTPAFSPEFHAGFHGVAVEAAAQNGPAAFVQGIFGGWVIALMVWLMPSAHHARVWIIVIFTWLLAVSGFTHIIAGTIEVLYLVFAREMSFATFLFSYVLPTLAGNTIGGLVLVSMLNHAQVTAGKDHE